MELMPRRDGARRETVAQVRQDQSTVFAELFDLLLYINVAIERPSTLIFFLTCGQLFGKSDEAGRAMADHHPPQLPSFSTNAR